MRRVNDEQDNQDNEQAYLQTLKRLVGDKTTPNSLPTQDTLIQCHLIHPSVREKTFPRTARSNQLVFKPHSFFVQHQMKGNKALFLDCGAVSKLEEGRTEFTYHYRRYFETCSLLGRCAAMAQWNSFMLRSQITEPPLWVSKELKLDKLMDCLQKTAKQHLFGVEQHCLLYKIPMNCFQTHSIVYGSFQYLIQLFFERVVYFKQVHNEYEDKERLVQEPMCKLLLDKFRLSVQALSEMEYVPHNFATYLTTGNTPRTLQNGNTIREYPDDNKMAILEAWHEKRVEEEEELEYEVDEEELRLIMKSQRLSEDTKRTCREFISMMFVREKEDSQPRSSSTRQIQVTNLNPESETDLYISDDESLASENKSTIDDIGQRILYQIEQKAFRRQRQEFCKITKAKMSHQMALMKERIKQRESDSQVKKESEAGCVAERDGAGAGAGTGTEAGMGTVKGELCNPMKVERIQEIDLEQAPQLQFKFEHQYKPTGASSLLRTEEQQALQQLQESNSVWTTSTAVSTTINIFNLVKSEHPQMSPTETCHRVSELRAEENPSFLKHETEAGLVTPMTMTMPTATSTTILPQTACKQERYSQETHSPVAERVNLKRSRQIKSESDSSDDIPESTPLKRQKFE